MHNAVVSSNCSNASHTAGSKVSLPVAVAVLMVSDAIAANFTKPRKLLSSEGCMMHGVHFCGHV